MHIQNNFTGNPDCDNFTIAQRDIPKHSQNQQSFEPLYSSKVMDGLIVELTSIITRSNTISINNT